MNSVELEKRAKELEDELNKTRGMISAGIDNEDDPERCRLITHGEHYLDAGERGFEEAIGAAGSAFDYNTFASKDQASDYARAINTFLRLRHQSGTIPPLPGGEFFYLDISDAGELVIGKCEQHWAIINSISPAFASQEDAQRVINWIGEDTIVHMMLTFHGLKTFTERAAYTPA